MARRDPRPSRCDEALESRPAILGRSGASAGVVARNAEGGVTWVQSFVSTDKRQTFCIYDGPSPEAVRQVAQKNALPVDTITEVRVLDPYFYH